MIWVPITPTPGSAWTETATPAINVWTPVEPTQDPNWVEIAT